MVVSMQIQTEALLNEIFVQWRSWLHSSLPGDSLVQLSGVK